MDFGLGLILSFTDNATSGINNAVNSLNRLTQTAEGAMSSLNSMASLSALSVVSNQMGNSFVQAGNSMIGVLTNLLGQTMKVGSNFEDFGITLTHLYGDADKANEALDKLLVYGAKTPFEVDDIKDMLVVLKSQGIDAFESIQGSISGLNQETLSWLGDIMAFKPDIPADRWKLAFTNFLGSGQAKVLENALDMGKIATSIGHEVGDTAEERLNSLIEFAEKNNIGGLMSKMFGTWSQVTSNMSDIWTMFVKKVADADVFENLKGAMSGLATSIAKLDEVGHLDALAEAIAGGLNLLIAPIAYLSGKLSELITKIGELAATNPEIVKFGTVFLGAAGVAMIAVGVLLKVVSALSGVSLLLMTMGKSFGDIGALFAMGTSKVLGVLAPFAIAVGAFILAWKTDFAGIRTFTVKAWNGILTAFNTARTAVNGSLDDMLRIISGFDKRNFFDNLTLAIMKLMILGRALVEGWNNYTLSDDTFQKMEALGLTPLVSRIFDLLYRFREFKKGFIEGWTEIGNRVKEVISGLFQAIDGTIFDSLFEGARKFFELLTNNDPNAWRQVGVVIGEIAAKGAIMFAVFKAFDWVIGKVGSVVGIFMSLFGVIGKVAGVFSNIGSIAARVFPNLAKLLSRVGSMVLTVIRAFNDLFTFIRGGFTVPTRLGAIFIRVFTVIKSAIMGIISFFSGIGATASAVIIAVVASVVTFIVTQKEKFLRMVSDLWEHIKTVFSGVKDRFMQVVGIVSSMIAPVITKVREAIDSIKQAFSSFTGSETVQVVISALVRVLSFLGEIILGIVFPALKILASFLGGTLKAAFDVIGGVVAGVVTAIEGLFSGLVNIISGIVSSISGIINTIGGLIKGILTGDFSLFFDGLKSMGQGIIQIFKGIIDIVGGLVVGVVEAFGGVIVGVYDLGASIVEGIIKGIGSFIGNAVTAIIDLGKSIIDAFKNLFGIHSPSTVFEGFGVNLIEGLLQGITNLWNTITSFFVSALDGLKSLFTSAWDAIKTVVSVALEGIRTVITTVWTAISTVIMTIVTGIQTFISAAWNLISSIISSVLNTIFGVVSSIWNSILSFISGVVNTILSVISSVWNSILSTISSVLSAISSTISSIWSGIVSAIQGFMSNIVSSIVGKFNEAKAFVTGLAGEAFSWGADIVSNIANGIKGAIGQVVGAVTGVADKIRSFLHFSVPDEGPLTDFESWMPDFMQGLANSITSSSDIVIQAITQFSTQITQVLTTGLLQTLQQFVTVWNQSMEVFAQSTLNTTTKVVQVFIQLSNSITQVFSVITQVSERMVQVFTQMGTILTQIATQVIRIFTQMGTALTQITSGVSTVFVQMWTTTQQVFSQMGTTVQQAFTLMLNGFSTMTQAITQFVTLIGQFSTQVNTAFTGLTQVFTQFVGLCGQGLTTLSQMTQTHLTGIVQLFMQMGTTLTQVSQNLVTALMQLGATLTQVFSNVSTFFVQMGTTISQVSSEMSTVFVQMRNVVQEVFTSMMNMAQQVVTRMGAGFKTLTTSLLAGFTQTTTVFNTMLTTMITGYNKLSATVTTTMNTLVNSTNTAMNQLVSTVSSAMSRAVSAVQSAVNTMKAAMNFQWKLPNLKVPHINVSGTFNLDPPSAPNFNVDWYANGGVFNKPNVIGVGEDGAEAVMPLERNTEWIGLLATEIGNHIGAANVPVTPVSSQQVSNTTTSGDTSYVTSTVGATTMDNSSYDNHVEFQAGAIVLQVKDTSAEEAERFATLIMEKIKRKQELERMAFYAT